ncbi:MAG: DNA-processing protein DprA [Candidatus Nanopelagicales bacterium]
MSSADVLARLALSQLTEPANERIGRALLDHQADEVVTQLKRGHADRLGLAELQGRWDGLDCMASAQREWEQAERLGVDLIAPGNLGWPTQLDDLAVTAPLILRSKGTIPIRQSAARSVAIVGARAATRYGCAVADELAATLAGRGWCVVSGAAFGIDAAAHFGALAVGGQTIAVSAAGADRPTPTANCGLFERIYTSGAVLSEVPLGAHPNRSRFLVRNRLIAALTRAVVVVEAAMKSGARSTAAQASALGRIVAAIPGPITSAMSVGCHSLIRDQQAVLVSSATEVLELLAPVQTALDIYAPTAAAQPDCRDVLGVLKADQPVGADLLGQLAGLSSPRVLAALYLLEQSGVAWRDRDGWRASGRGGRALGSG